MMGTLIFEIVDVWFSLTADLEYRISASMYVRIHNRLLNSWTRIPPSPTRDLPSFKKLDEENEYKKLVKM